MPYQPLWTSRKAEILAAAARVQTNNPAAWQELKVPGQTSRAYIQLVAADCQSTVSPEIGCNLKRGGPEMSLDVLAMPNPTGCVDATGTYPGLELIDIVGGAEGPNPTLGWLDQTQKTMDAGVSGGWVTGEPAEPVLVEPYPSEPNWWGAVFTPTIRAQYTEAGRVFPDTNTTPAGIDATLAGFRWWSRTGYKIRDGMTKEVAMADTVQELRKELGLG